MLLTIYKHDILNTAPNVVCTEVLYIDRYKEYDNLFDESFLYIIYETVKEVVGGEILYS